MPKLTDAQVTARLATLPGWSVSEGLLTKTYKVRSFAHGVLFIGTIGQLAEAANHHPDLLVHGWNRLRITLSTHSAGGLTAADLALAERIDAVLGGG